MMEVLLVVMAFFSFIVAVVGLMAAHMKNEDAMTVFGDFSVILFATFFGLCMWTISYEESYQESIIMDYCNGKIVVDTVAVTNDGKLYKIKIKEEVK